MFFLLKLRMKGGISMIDKSEIFRSRDSFPIRADKSGMAGGAEKSYAPDEAPDTYIGDLPESEHPEKGENFLI